MDNNVSDSTTRAKKTALSREAIFLSLELTEVLFWSSLVIILFRLSSLLLTIFPLKLADLAWQAKASFSLMESAPVFILGMLLLLFSEVLNPVDEAIKRRALRVRQLSYVLAILFFLLTPLQPWLGLQSMRAANAADKEVLIRYTKAIGWMENSTHHYELISAATHLPTRIPLLSARLEDPFEPLKANYLRSAKFLQRSAIEDSKMRRLRRREQTLFSTLRNLLMYLLSFLAFASMAKLKPMEPPLLIRLINKVLNIITSMPPPRNTFNP